MSFQMYICYAVQQVYCDMVTDGGGWTVFQRRQDGSENFYRGWSDYVAGFGNLTGEFWLGLEKMHRLTAINATMLRIDMADFDRNTAYAAYSTFRILGSSTNYVLNVGGYSGTAGDALTGDDQTEHGRAFSTRDRDNDRYSGNCAQLYNGAWWYDQCHDSNLNGLYHGGSHPENYADGVVWEPWRGHYYSLQFAEMKLR